jgi:methyl-accepting chemotaxis protein
MKFDIAQVMKQLSDLKLLFQRNTNLKREFDSINTSISGMKESMKNVQHDTYNTARDLTQMIEKNAAAIRINSADIKQQAKFIEQRLDDDQRLQDIIGQFKDRIVEKFKTMTDEFTMETKTIEKRYMALNEKVSNLYNKTESNSNYVAKHDRTLYEHQALLDEVQKEQGHQ